MNVHLNVKFAQLILSIFLQPPHVSGVSRPIIRRYNLRIQLVLIIIVLVDCLLSWSERTQFNQDNRQSSKQNNKYQLLYAHGFTS